MTIKYDKFLLFVGSGRSGSTIVAKILDFHPNIAIASETGIIKFNFKSNKDITNKIINDWNRKGLWPKSLNKNIKNKQINIKKQNITIIGDKHSDQNTLNIYRKIELFEKFKSVVNNLNLIHIIRNPYDVITTKYLRKKKIFDKKKGFRSAIDQYYIEMETVSRISENTPILNIYLEKLIESPEIEISKIFDCLNVNYSTDIVNTLKDILAKRPNYSRKNYNWLENDIQLVKNIINKNGFLNGYTFDIIGEENE